MAPASQAGNRCHVDLSFEIGETPPDLKALTLEAVEKVERAVLDLLIKQRRYNLTELATVLDFDPKTLRKRIRKYGLDP